MGNLYLVRHGQASLGAEDYDQLSELGQRQSLRLGEYWRSKGLQFEAVLTGTLRRHAQTWDYIAQGIGYSLKPLVWPGLNEYNAEALIRAVQPHASDSTGTPEAYRQHFRWLREGLTQWAKGAISPEGMPDYASFVSGVSSALDHVRQNFEGHVLIVSSGGPIATAVSQVLNAPSQALVDLNMRIRNSAVTEFVFNPKRHSLLSFNTLPHLDHPDLADWVTYA
jgi:broad specificity phosphatase PhoE